MSRGEGSSETSPKPSGAAAAARKGTSAVSFVSGAIAGGTVKTLTAPLSRSTILLQTASSESLNSLVLSPSSSRATWGSPAAFARTSLSYLSQVRAMDGVISFWKGNGASILQKMATTGSNYVVYEQAKNSLRPLWRDELDVGFWVRLLAGSMAGALNVTLAYPLDLARTNIASSRTQSWASIAATLGALRKDHGLGFLRRGLLCTQLCQGLNVGIHFGVYETLSTRSRANTDDRRAPRTSWLHSYASGSLAGLVASTLVQPLDLVRRRQQLRGAPDADRWFFMVAADIARRDGVHALYRGILPEIFKVCVIPSSGLNFLIYEFVRQDLFGERSGVR